MSQNRNIAHSKMFHRTGRFSNLSSRKKKQMPKLLSLSLCIPAKIHSRLEPVSSRQPVFIEIKRVLTADKTPEAIYPPICRDWSTFMIRLQYVWCVLSKLFPVIQHFRLRIWRGGAICVFQPIRDVWWRGSSRDVTMKTTLNTRRATPT